MPTDTDPSFNGENQTADTKVSRLRSLRMIRLGAWCLAALLLAAMAGWQARNYFPEPEKLPVIDSLGGNFSLQSTRGGISQLSDFKGKVVLLNFGYTSCPDVCPTVLARMRDLVEVLDKDNARIQSIFVTLDPERDSIERLGSYVAAFDKSFIGMTGTTEEIVAATAPFKVMYMKEASDSALVYDISHNSHIYVLDELGRVRTTFDHGITVPEMINTLKGLLEEES